MSTHKDNTAQAKYIAGAGTSWMIAGLANPVTADTNIEIRTDHCNPDAYRAPAPQEERTYKRTHSPSLFPTIAYDDGGWGE